MKLFITSIAVLFSTSIILAQPPKGKATSGTIYGAKTSAEGAVSLNEVSEILKTKEKI